ncbi:MAG: hypothetical protein ACJA16_004652 [Akkermansiaceae bacterium]|jgi:hypothetical protein
MKKEHRDCLSDAGSVPHRKALRDDIVHHLSVDIGETEIPSTISISERLMIESEQVEHRRVQVVEVDLVLHRFVAKLVGFAISKATADTAPRHEDGVARRIVVSTG